MLLASLCRRDLGNVRVLLRRLTVARASEALHIVAQYFHSLQLPVQTPRALQELLGDA